MHWVQEETWPSPQCQTLPQQVNPSNFVLGQDPTKACKNNFSFQLLVRGKSKVAYATLIHPEKILCWFKMFNYWETNIKYRGYYQSSITRTKKKKRSYFQFHLKNWKRDACNTELGIHKESILERNWMYQNQSNSNAYHTVRRGV